MQTEVERYWAKVTQGDGCWNWQAALRNGYGVFARRQPDGRYLTFYAHRLSWEYTYGPIPEGLWVLHTCDNRSCVRPDHLWLGTNADNLADMRAKGRGVVPTARSGPDHHWYGRNVSGERNPHARLTEADVADIRAAAAGEKRNDIAQRHGITRSHVQGILSGRAWRH